MVMVVVMVTVIHVVPHVVHCNVISTTETLAIVLTYRRIYVRMAVFFAVIYVRHTMMIEVLARAFNAVVKALPLHIAKFGRRRIPPRLILRVTRALLRSGGIRSPVKRTCQTDCHTYQRHSKPFELHCGPSFGYLGLR